MGNATPDPVYNLETAPNSFPSWQFIPPNSGPLPSNTKVITTNHTGEAMDDLDIVERLIRAQLPICFEAAQLITWIRQERDEARRTLCLVEAAILSFGPNGVPYHPSVAHKIAGDYGWDCFKDDTDG